MRSLVHIERIHTIVPIEGADKIEIVKLLDWQMVAKRGEFKVGDLGVFHEVDCIVPAKPEYEFLASRNYKIKTAKFLKNLSQGLVLPLSILPPGNYKEGQDVTELVGAIHMDKESRVNFELEKKKKNKLLKFLFKYKIFRSILMPFFQKEKGKWPEFIAHTDEENVQAVFSRVKRDFGSETFYVTEKIDYQSATFFTRTVEKNYFGFKAKKKIFGVCSRTIWKKTPDGSLWWKIAEKFNIEKILRKYDFDLTIQGEQGDLSVQKNKYKITESDFWVFNIIRNSDNYHYSLEEMEAFCKENGLKFVPVLDRNYKLPETVLELLDYSKGKSVLNKDTEREGVVIRLIRDGKKLVSFKVRNPDFLMKWDE